MSESTPIVRPNATVHQFTALWDASVSRRGFLSFSRQAAVTLEGQSVGLMRAVDLRDVAGLGWVLTIHEAGHSYWSGRGQRGHAGQSYRVVVVEPSPDYMRYVELANFDVVNPSDRVEASTKIRDRLHTI